MSKYDFYTPRELAQVLLQLIPADPSVTRIADICCGTWNLLSAAHSRFPKATLTGVDINAEVQNNGIHGALFYVKDGRDFANEMDRQGFHYDLLLSNPPFGMLSSSQKKYSGKESIQKFKRYESELLYANYLLLKDNGYLLIILPVTYVKGSQYKSHRIWIAKNFDVLSIVDLPINTFGNKSLHTVALVLKKSNTPQNISAEIYNARLNQECWSLLKTHSIASSKIVNGEWFASSDVNTSKFVIYRGSVSSQFFSKNGEPILHCSSTSVNGIWEPAIRKCSGIKESHRKYAESGDVIINRIGKNAAAWKIYLGPPCLISDCIIVIKSPNDNILEAITKISCDGILQVSKLGVSTPYISSTEISNLLNKNAD